MSQDTQSQNEYWFVNLNKNYKMNTQMCFDDHHSWSGVIVRCHRPYFPFTNSSQSKPCVDVAFSTVLYCQFQLKCHFYMNIASNEQTYVKQKSCVSICICISVSFVPFALVRLTQHRTKWIVFMPKKKKKKKMIRSRLSFERSSLHK